jgi:TP901 family phage tail tape measure protein
MAAEDYSIRINVDSSSATQAQANLNRLNSTVTQTERELNNTSSAARAAAASLSGLASVAKIAATSIAAISFRQAVQEMSSFETKMLQLKALTMANETQMRSMEKQARVLGATTAFSAQQAAEAQGVLASAGLKTNEILKATPQILQLAAAGNLELAKSAEIAIATMHGMGLALGDLGHINDVLTKVAADYTINVKQVGHAMGEASATANAYGVSLEAVASSIGILKENGIEAGSIGDNIKSLFTALVNDTKENVEILGHYTIGLDKHKMTYKDLSVETLGYTKVLSNLKEANIGATDATKLFGTDAFNAGIILGKNVDKILENETAYKKLIGTAQEMADILNQGLAKAWDALKGVMTESYLQIGEPNGGGVTGSLTRLIQEATGVISIYEGLGDEFSKSNKLTKEQYENLKSVASELHLIGGAVGGIVAVTSVIWAANTAMIAFNAASRANPFVMGATMVGAGIGLGLAQRNEEMKKGVDIMSKSNSVEEASQKLAMQREKMNSFKEKAKDFVSGGRTGQENTAILKVLEQRQAEQIYYANNPIKADIPVIEAHTKATEKHAVSLGTNAAEAEKITKAHKGLTDAQRAAKKEQAAIDKANDNDPLQKYLADMRDLAKLRGKLLPETFLLNEQKIAAEFEKSTVGIEKLTEAERERQRVFEQTARGKFEKSTDELRAQKPFMSQAEYANKQDKISVDYLHDTGQNKDAKTQIDLATEAQKAFKDELAKTTAVFYDVSNSGKMAFDGILGGISSVASAFSEFEKSIDSIDKKWADYGANYSKLMQMEGATQAEKTALTEKYYKDKQAYESASFQAEISGARSIAGATAKMFSEKSAARKAFHGIEMGLAVVEMAMSAKKMIVDVAAGAANMFAQGGFAGFAGVAAMAAVMGGLGFAMSSGSGKTVDNTTPATKSIGTILGDNNATSNSVENIVNTLNDIHSQEYPELKAMADNFKGIDRNMYKLQQQMARATVNFTNTQNIGIPSQATGAKSQSPIGSTGSNAALIGAGGAIGAVTGGGALGVGLGMVTGVGAGTVAGGVGFSAGATSILGAQLSGGAILGIAGGLLIAGLAYGLGKLLGIGKTKITQLGEGIVINSGKLLQDGMTTAVDAQTWRKDEFKTKGWFSDTKKIVETYGQLSDEIAGTLQGVSDNLTGGMLSIAKNLNVLDVLMYKFTDVASRPFLKIDFFKDGKRVDDVNKVLTDQINAWADRAAKNVFGILFGEYQKLNEGMMETVSRLAIQVAGVKGAYAKLGFSLGETNLGLIHFSDTMVQIFQSSAKADDGLKNFIQGMNEVYEFSTNQGQKSQLGFTKGEQALKDLGLNVDITDTITVKAAMLQLSEMSAKTIAETTAAQDNLRKLKEPVEAYNNPTPATSLTEYLGSLGTQYKSDWQKLLGVTDFESATVETIAKAGVTTIEAMTKSTIPTWRSAAEFVLEKENIKAAAASKGGASVDLKTLTSQINDANAEIETLGLLAAKQVDATQYLKETEKTMKNISSLQDEYLKTTMNEEQWLAIERNRIIDEQYKDLKINVRDFANLNPVTDAMLKANPEKYTYEITDALKATDSFIDKFGKDYVSTLEVGKKVVMITASEYKTFTDQLIDTGKELKKLSEGGKYLMDFSRSIDAWVKNLRATQLGTPESQLKASQSNFSEQMKLAQFGATAEIKRQALSGITGYADTYINALKNYYASSEEGVNAIEQVIKEVSGLEKGLDIQELQLNELQLIKDAIEASTIEIPKGISLKSEVIFKNLIENAQIAALSAKQNPTTDNLLRYDAYASMILTIDKSANGGAESGFIDKLISSVDGKDGLAAGVRLIVDSAEFSASQKESIINGVMADFNRQINFDVAKSFETEVERVNNSWKSVELPTTATDNAKTSVIGLTGGLKGLNGEYDFVMFKTTDTGKKIIDFSNTANNTKFGLNAESVESTVASFKQIEESANKARDAISALAMADAAKIQAEMQAAATPSLEVQAVNAGYSGDYTDEAAMRAWLVNPVMPNPYQSSSPLSNQYQGTGTTNYTPSSVLTLPNNIGLSTNAANDSVASTQTVVQLEEMNRKQEIMINTLIAAAQESRKQNAALVSEIEGLRTDTRLKRAA